MDKLQMAHLLPGLAITLPYRAEAELWVFTIPMATFLLWAYFRAPHHFLKRFFYVNSRATAEGWARVFRLQLPPDRGPSRSDRVIGNTVFWLLLTALMAHSVCSLGIYAGLLQNPKTKWEILLEQTAPRAEDYELVFGPNSASARPKAPATTQLLD